MTYVVSRLQQLSLWDIWYSQRKELGLKPKWQTYIPLPENIGQRPEVVAAMCFALTDAKIKHDIHEGQKPGETWLLFTAKDLSGWPPDLCLLLQTICSIAEGLSPASPKESLAVAQSLFDEAKAATGHRMELPAQRVEVKDVKGRQPDPSLRNMASKARRKREEPPPPSK